VPALTDLEVEFVSLVDRAAVRDPVNQSEPMRFLVWKRESPDEGAASMTPEEKAALDKAQADLKKAQDDLKAATDTIATQKAEGDKLAEKVATLEKAAEPAKKDEPIDKSDLPPAVRAALEKAETEAATNRERAEKSEKTANEALAKAQASEDAALTRDYIAKAETYKALPIEAAKFGPVLKSAAEKLTKDELAELERVLKAADAAIAETDLFKEQGRSREGSKDGSALTEMTKRTTELRKSDPRLSEGAAMDLVMKADTELQARYLAETR
jgi:hypothetical protein